MRIPRLINDTDEMNVAAKDDDDTMMGMKNGELAMKVTKNGGLKSTGMNARPRQQVNADVNWSGYVKFYESTPREVLADTIAKILLQVKPGVSMDLIKQYADQSGRENFIKTATIQIMSTPEYQLS
jgi:hypothetical protein